MKTILRERMGSFRTTVEYVNSIAIKPSSIGYLLLITVQNTFSKYNPIEYNPVEYNPAEYNPIEYNAAGKNGPSASYCM